MRVKTKKATFSLHIDVLNALDNVMAQGVATSKNALVEQALIKEINELRRQAIKARWQEAAKDPLFLKDMEQTEHDFIYVDSEISGSKD